MLARVLSCVLGVTVIVSPAWTERDGPLPSDARVEARDIPRGESPPQGSRAPRGTPPVDQASERPLVQADLQPAKQPAVSPSPSRTENVDPDQIEPEPGTGRRPRNGRATASARSRRPVDRVIEITAPPATTFDPIEQTNLELGHDPQIAVSEHYVVATTTRTVVFFDKRGDRLPGKPNFFGVSPPTRMDTNELFAPVLEPFLRGPDGQPDRRQPNPNDINRHLGPQTGDPSLICTPDHPTQSGCINEAYDTRVAYDRRRQRFWIVAALRDQVWGPNFAKCGEKACAPLDTKIPRRFVGVAVSLTDDPRDGFHEFVLVDEYADWPRFALHGPFLIISHDSNTKVHLFDAQKLADGNVGHEPVGRGNFDETDFNHSPHLVDQIVPVVQHDRRDENDENQAPFIPTVPVDPEVSKNVPTFLVAIGVGIGGTEITIFAFDPNDALLSTIRHPKLTLATVPLDVGSFTLKINAAYRNGFIYVVGQRCVSGSGGKCNHELQFVKIPVFRGSGPVASTIIASKIPSMGFVATAFGGLGHDSPHSVTGPSFEIPGVDVNKNDDVVIVYERSGFGANLLGDAPGAFFRLVTKAGVETDGILHLAHCGPSAEEKVRCAPEQPYESNIDTAGIAVDPSDDATIWMAHAIADSDLTSTKRYRMAIGRIKP